MHRPITQLVPVGPRGVGVHRRHCCSPAVRPRPCCTRLGRHGRGQPRLRAHAPRLRRHRRRRPRAGCWARSPGEVAPAERQTPRTDLTGRHRGSLRIACAHEHAEVPRGSLDRRHLRLPLPVRLQRQPAAVIARPSARAGDDSTSASCRSRSTRCTSRKASRRCGSASPRSGARACSSLLYGIAVRDTFPDQFFDAHIALFAARHEHGKQLKDEDVLRDAVAVGGPRPRRGRRGGQERPPAQDARGRAHRGVEQYGVFGVPTFLEGDEAAFVRFMDRGNVDDLEKHARPAPVVSAQRVQAPAHPSLAHARATIDGPGRSTRSLIASDHSSNPGSRHAG